MTTDPTDTKNKDGTGNGTKTENWKRFDGVRNDVGSEVGTRIVYLSRSIDKSGRLKFHDTPSFRQNGQ